MHWHGRSNVKDWLLRVTGDDDVHVLLSEYMLPVEARSAPTGLSFEESSWRLPLDGPRKDEAIFQSRDLKRNSSQSQF
jgi:hypothetical protein